MLNMVAGCSVPDASKLAPAYERDERGLLANVNAEDICPLMEEFLSMQNDRVFLILEVQSNLKDEELLRKHDTDQFHIDVFYWDGLPKEYAIDLLQKNQELLIHDGMSTFGFGSHGVRAEILLEQYNVVRIFSEEPSLYEALLERHGIPRVHELQTAWTQFGSGAYGECRAHKYHGKTIYDFIEFLKPYGLYFAERRELQ